MEGSSERCVRMLESNWSVYKRTKWFMQRLEGCLGQVTWHGSNDKGFINLKLTNFKREDDNENLKSDDCRNNGAVETSGMQWVIIEFDSINKGHDSRKERAQVFPLFGMFLYQGWRYYGALPIYASSSHSWQPLTSTLFNDNQDLKDHQGLGSATYKRIGIRWSRLENPPEISKYIIKMKKWWK